MESAGSLRKYWAQGHQKSSSSSGPMMQRPSAPGVGRMRRSLAQLQESATRTQPLITWNSFWGERPHHQPHSLSPLLELGSHRWDELDFIGIHIAGSPGPLCPNRRLLQQVHPHALYGRHLCPGEWDVRSCLAQGSSPPLPQLSQAVPTQGHIKRSSQVPSPLWGESGVVRKSQQWPEQALGLLHCLPSPGTKISQKIPEEGPWICSSEIL